VADTVPRIGRFDRVASLACALLDAPAALVFGFGDGRAVLVGAHGVDPGDPALQAYADGAALSDAAIEAAGGALRPVATVPIPGAPGVPRGTLVVLDRGPGDWAPEARDRLAALAALAADLPFPEASGALPVASAEGRSAFLAEVSALMDASLDYEATFTRLARLTVPILADYCLIDALEPDGGLRRIAKAHVDAELEKVLFSGVRHEPGADPDRHPTMRAIRTGTSILVRDATDDVIATIAHDDDHRRLLREVMEIHSFMVIPLRARGRVLGILTLVFSQSRRRYGPDELTLAEELAARAALAIDNARLYGLARQAVRAREGVLTVVSHDLRNPLAAILLNTTTAMELAPPGVLPPWLMDSLRHTAELVEQSNRLIENLLDLSRIDSGGIAISPLETDAVPLAAGVVRMFRRLADVRGVELVLEAPGRPLPLTADPDRIAQVLANLVGNALKFTEAGGHVRLAVEERGGNVVFVVEDDGSGIDLRDQESIFEPFRQVEPGDRRGVGLGLPIARGILQAHGGRLEVRSAPGEGSTFTVTLPAG
jgi:signal transduction histidine kinase